MSETESTERAFRGLPMSGGVAVGPVCLFREREPLVGQPATVEHDGILREIERFTRAVRAAARRVQTLRRQTEQTVGQSEAGIFEAHQALIEDISWHDQVAADIRLRRVAAEVAVKTVLDRHEQRMRKFSDPHLRERAADVMETRRHVLTALGTAVHGLVCESGGSCSRGRNRIVVTDELTPAMTLGLDTEHLLGFVTERGGMTSHAAILARALGIPSVSGVAGIVEQARCGMELAMDGSTGEVVLRPGARTQARFDALAGHFRRTIEVEDPLDGYQVSANINLASETALVDQVKADGIGLYRTEFEFMARGRLLDEQEQYELYAAVVAAARGRAVTFRLFDAGGDKIVPFIEHPRESNPALGWRGARLLLDRIDILSAQARALARASRHGPVRVLYPMIADRGQFERIKAAFERAAQDIPAGQGILHGAMLEVPAACLQARDILDAADFASVGTNDLIQHLFVVDRTNERVAHEYDPDRPVFWTLLDRMARAAEAAGKPLTICGELAGNPEYVPRLMRLGVRSVSVSPRQIRAVRRRAKEVLADTGSLNERSALGQAEGI